MKFFCQHPVASSYVSAVFPLAPYSPLSQANRYVLDLTRETEFSTRMSYGARLLP